MTKGRITMYCTIIWNKGHYEVFSADGSFLFSADTRAEAMEELDDWEEKRIA
ncbi:MAG: hypothetical protein IJG45_02180 [Oscillospiraceae bacterium]|nr:hypothetical protein [Oscillospiraceae bacterium]